MAIELSPRTEQILEIVVREYVAHATPVSSKRISGRYDLGVSPATIRNEMALLEELGYLTHPYTSAGRMPTVSGYRYFVEHLMGRSELTRQEEAHIEREIERARAALDLEQCMRLTASLLARTTGSASWVTAPRSRKLSVRHVELISLSRERALLILVPSHGKVREELIRLPGRFGPERLSRSARRLTEELAGRGPAELASLKAEDPLTALVLQKVGAVLQAMEDEPAPQVYQDGLSHILSQPEFTDVHQARRVLELWEQGKIVRYVLTQHGRSRSVQVVIAGEGRWEPIEDYSLVFSRYGSARQASGLLGVMGPLRMPYGKAVSAVRFVSRLLSERLSDLYGN